MQYTLTGTTLIIEFPTPKYPISVTLDSAAGGRKIEFSTNYGVEYWQPIIDVTTATMLVTYSEVPITHVKVTGAIADVVSIVGALRIFA